MPIKVMEYTVQKNIKNGILLLHIARMIIRRSSYDNI